MSQEKAQEVSRRSVFLGAGTVGALAAGAALMSRGPAVPTEVAAEPKPAPEKGGGYQLSEHVKHYYRTTRV